ncbi:MAG: molybdenum cofactor guanylyltransferase [Deltaproteobacteria bacterium]|jgi:molybdopterin-guanine dinucleotide biosynthesis protein A|nr:molybdenum cofactor guanylyltransferase [Deltaproteobacteria bacterium]
MDVTGVILAGGSSSRLGQDKALLLLDARFPVNLYTRAAQLLQTLLPRVLIVGRAHPHFSYIEDDIPGTGPVGGVVTALRHARTPCLVLSCDLPFMNRQTLTTLLAARAERPGVALRTIFVHQATGSLEPLVALYEPEALNYLEPLLADRKLKLAWGVPEALQHRVMYTQAEALPFFSINRPADLQAARRILASMPDWDF